MSTQRIPSLPAIAAAVPLIGFAVLALFAVTMPRTEANVPGLMHFPSAFIGDAILLPFAAGLLGLGVTRLPRVAGSWLLGIGAALAGAVGTVSTQVLWLADDHPRLNWTLPRPHFWNAAGIWHLVYSAAVSALVVFLVVELLLRLRAQAVPKIATGPGATFVWMLVLSYVALVVHDSAAPTAASRTTVVAMGVSMAVGVLVCVAALGRRAVVLARPAALGALTAAGVSLLADGWLDVSGRDIGMGLSTTLFVAAAAGALPLVASPGWLRPRISRRTVLCAMTGATGGGVLLCALWIRAVHAEITGDRYALVVVAVCQLLALVSVFALVAGVGALRRVADGLGALALILWIAGPAAWVVGWIPFRETEFVLSVVLAIVVYLFLFPVVTRRLDVQIMLEHRLRRRNWRGTLPPSVRRSAAATMVFLLCSFMATALALLMRTLDVLVGLNLRDGVGWPAARFSLIASVGLIVGVLAIGVAS
jgi:hypothetical protein